VHNIADWKLEAGEQIQPEDVLFFCFGSKN
jgi:hypothetical protein